MLSVPSELTVRYLYPNSLLVLCQYLLTTARVVFILLKSIVCFFVVVNYITSEDEISEAKDHQADRLECHVGFHGQRPTREQPMIAFMWRQSPSPATFRFLRRGLNVEASCKDMSRSACTW